MEDDAALVDHVNIIAEALQIAGNVRADEDGAIRIRFHVFPKEGEKLIPCHHIKAGGRLVEEQKPGVVGDGDKNLELRLHAGGKLPNLFAKGQLGFLYLFHKKCFVKLLIEAAQHRKNIADGQIAGKTGIGEHNAQILLVRGSNRPDILA